MNLYKKNSAIDEYIYFADVGLHFSFFSLFSGPNIGFPFFLQHNEFVMNVFLEYRPISKDSCIFFHPTCVPVLCEISLT